MVVIFTTGEEFVKILKPKFGIKSDSYSHYSDS